MKIEQLVANPTFDPKMPLEQMLEICAEIGFRKFENFTTWTQSAFDLDQDPEFYRALGERYGLRFTSMHLPDVTGSNRTSFERAVEGVRFARELGVEVVILKADSLETFGDVAEPVLDAAEQAGITVVITNHAGTALSTLDDYRTALAKIDDPRMKALLEVGHFQAVGVDWRQGYELLQDRIALVHIKDMRDRQPVPYGQGEVDFRGLFAHMRDVGYRGNFVVELEKVPREQAVDLLREAFAFLERIES